MPITVSMIEEKEFKIKMRGYDPVEVDEFLDEICDEMVIMQEEITSLQSRVAQGGAQRAAAFAPVPLAVPVVAPVPTPIPAPLPLRQESVADQNSEQAKRLLERAQKFYDDTVAEAEQKAKAILSGANARVTSGLEDLELERDQLKAEIEMLRATAKDYRARFLRLVEDQQHVLHAETELFE